MITDSLILTFANAVFAQGNKELFQAYQQKHGRLPIVANPERFTERMLWRKILDHNPRFVVFSDKLATKEYIQRLCPELAVPPTLWVGQNADAIPDELLSGDVYVKANHGCDFNIRIRGYPGDRAALKMQTDLWLGLVYGQDSGQWAYSQIEAKLFVEEAVGDVETGMVELSVRVCNGRAIMGSVMGFSKKPNKWMIYLDPEGKLTRGVNDPEGKPLTPLPKGLMVMEPYFRAVKFAERLGTGVDYIRCDFMWNGRELFGGEITVYPAAGLKEPANQSANAVILHGWDLLESNFFRTRQTGWKKVYASALKRKLIHAKSRGHPPSEQFK